MARNVQSQASIFSVDENEAERAKSKCCLEAGHSDFCCTSRVAAGGGISSW